MNDFDHDIGMATYALVADIENWTDLAKEEAARKLLTKDLPVIFDALDKLLEQTQLMIHEGTEHASHQRNEGPFQVCQRP